MMKHCGQSQTTFQKIVDDEWTELSQTNDDDTMAEDQSKARPAFSHSLYMFGNNTIGQCGIGKNRGGHVDTPTLVPPVWGSKSVVDVSCGQAHTLALIGAQTGQVYAWGSGEHGQLGTQSVLSYIQAIDTIHLRDRQGAIL